MSHLVSAIIIFLDEEKYLSEAIESVCAQNYPNWELLLVDDGSTDGSGAIACAFAERCPQQIRYLTHPGGANRGMSASRNLGLGHARGSMVGFLDGDDAWLPDKLKRQVDLFRDNPAAIIISGASLYWHSWNDEKSEEDRLVRVGELMADLGGRSCTVEQDRLHAGEELMRALYPLGKGVTPSTSGMLIRRDAIQSIGGFEEKFRGLFEDQVFLAKSYLVGPMFVSSECFDLYRQHDESCCRTTRSTVEAKKLKAQFFSWWASHLSASRFREAGLRAEVRRRSLQYGYPRLHRWYIHARRRFWGA
jgi:glycosyltransferase involved in cell wall biosynthesis